MSAEHKKTTVKVLRRLKLLGRKDSLLFLACVAVAALAAPCCEGCAGASARKDSAVDVDSGEASPDAYPGDVPDAPLPFPHACLSLLPDTAKLLLSMLDQVTGLPYDQLECGGPYVRAGGVNPAAGVVPQLASGAIKPFPQSNLVDWSFVDDVPGIATLDRLFALKIALQLDPASDAGGAQDFGGITWDANVSIERYSKIRIRYTTGSTIQKWQVKLNSGTGTATHEFPAYLPDSRPGDWTEHVFDIATDFAGTDLAHLNYITFGTNLADASTTQPTLWVDRLAFEVDSAQSAAPSKLDTCGVVCDGPFPDLACNEPMTGAVNIANALTALSVLPKIGLYDLNNAKNGVTKILTTLSRFPGTAALFGNVFQDWHSPVSGVANPRNSIASLTDLPQLYAALMVVEGAFPELAAAAAQMRARIDLSTFYDASGGCPGKLKWSIDRCKGPQADTGGLDNYGTDSFLGSFVAVASQAAPSCYFANGLAGLGCSMDGPASTPWYTTGRSCVGRSIPGTDTGGPFLQLASLVYLDGTRIHLGGVTLADSAANMLRSQADFASAQKLPLFGWASAANPNSCGYMGCGSLCAGGPSVPGFGVSEVTPYVSAMGLDLLGTTAAANLDAFQAAGAGAPLVTGTQSHQFGLRDAWNQSTGTGRDSYLFLDAGWTALGLVNACYGGLVRQLFSQHDVAQYGYNALSQGAPPCTHTPCSSLGHVRIDGQTPTTPPATTALVVHSPVKVEWTPSACDAVVQVYRDEQLVFPASPNDVSHSGVELGSPTPRSAPYEIKIWLPGAFVPAVDQWVRVAETFDDLETYSTAWDACAEDPAFPCDGSNPNCCLANTSACGLASNWREPDSVSAALALSRSGGSNCHFYLNRAATEAMGFQLTARFRFDHEQICTPDAGAPSIQAIEATISQWTGLKRFEFAAQVMNVTDGVTPAPALRIWNGHSWVVAPLASGSACTASDQWHEIVLKGSIDGDNVRYERLSLDCLEVTVDETTTFPSVQDATPAKLAVGVQLDANATGSPYTVFLDKVGYELRY